MDANHVKRTANRPLPGGQVTEKEALTLFAVLVVFSFMNDFVYSY
jgi:4-hydroxybenzoate polyprenyltransferase and related prenyltransferases